MVTDDNKLQLLNDHYKDSFTLIQNHIQRRDYLLFLIIIAVTAVLFQVFSPDLVNKIISQLIEKNLQLSVNLNISFIGSVIWFGLLGLIVRYFQAAVHIERQYKYIHKLEDQLSSHYSGMAFTREGRAYLEKYPLFSNWTAFLYATLFPVLLLIVVVFKTLREVAVSPICSGILWFDVLVALGIIISTVLYMLLVHFEK